MALLELPNELLRTIFDLTRPYGFENLVLTCKHMYNKARPVITRHNELRRKYRNFRFNRRDEDPTSDKSIDALTWFVPQLLLNIARDPWVAVYIVHADVGERNNVEDYYREGDSKYKPVVEQLDAPENRNLIRKLLRESSFLRSIGADPDQWLQRIMEDDDQWEEPCEFGLAFLMSLLVNVESLILPGVWTSANAEPLSHREEDLDHVQSEVSQLMQLLVKLANDGTTHPWPLKKLQKLLPSRDPDGQMGMDMLAIAPFLSLESMRDVRHASGKYICYPNAPLWDTMYPVIGPNIVSLDLIDYVIDDDASATFFKDMGELKILKMEYNMKDEIGDEWGAGIFVQNLMSAVGSQLEVLSLRVGGLYAYTSPIVDLSGFTALRELELDVELFYCWVMSDDADDENEADDADDSDGSDSDDSDEPDSSILDMLPESLPTLKELRLQCLCMKKDVERLEILLRDFGSTKSMQLPNLVTTEVYLDVQGGSTLREWGDGDEYLRKAQRICGEIGNVEVSISDRWNHEKGIWEEVPIRTVSQS